MAKFWLPALDPLGILERITKDAPIPLKDPLRAALLGGGSPFHSSMWLSPKQREEIQKKYGAVATRWGEEFAPEGEIETAEAMAKFFYEKLLAAAR